MFLQIIQGPVGDAAAARATMDRWLRDLEPGATGWLGGTYGITDDGMLVAIVRFESRESARRNSERPEQAAWWREMAACFAGEITFHDCDDVMLLLGGGSDDARFVQLIQGRLRDRERAHALAEQSGKLISQYRPDVLGATIAIDDDGFFIETVGFSSEAEARAGEEKEMPAEVGRLIEEEMSLLDDVRYLDLHEPWFASRR
ncbi:MAG TPA: hypothetical protein VMV92_17520 [Streptosporangiaceae bacterium]|nr:hypothetical protein [Streptosporangiaceae bacterium]